MGQVEDVLLLLPEAVFGKQCAEFADLVEEQVGVPMLAVELVPFDIRKHAVGQRDQLVVGRLVLLGVEQLAIIGDELFAFLHQLLGRPLDIRAGPDLLDIARQGGEGHGQVVVP